MRRSAFFFALLAASTSVSACDLPAATFNAVTSSSSNPTSSGGSTGSGGETTGPMHTGGGGMAGGGSGGSGTTSTAGSGGTGGSGGSGGTTTTTDTGGIGGAGGVPGVAVVPCNYPNVSDCMKGQVCCFDKSMNSPMDHCADKGSCNPSSKYAEIQCNDPSDCPNQKCCAYVPGGVEKTYCADSCSVGASEVPACSGDAECIANAAPFIKCKSVLGYAAYKFCQLP